MVSNIERLVLIGRKAKGKQMKIQNKFIQYSSGDQRDPLLEVLRRSQQYNIQIQKVLNRYLIDRRGHKLIDFASCNYLSFDQDQAKLLPAGVRAAKKFGMHTSRARLMGYHELFTSLEKKLARFVGAEDSVIFPNTTLTGIGIIPALMKKDDVIILDKASHATMYQAAQMARDKGTLLKSYRQDDFAELERILEEHQHCRRKLICIDGVYSMTGDYASLKELMPLARKYEALVYLDDGHGFGFVGEKPTHDMPYGFCGNGIVKHLAEKYDNLMYVAGTAKGLAAGAAFATVTPQMKEFLMAYAKPLDYTHPSTPFCLGVLDAALDHLENVGEARRVLVYKMTKRLVDGLRGLGFYVMTKTHFPIISVWAGDTEKLILASRQLYRDGIFLTSCPYPTMPRGKEALRITVTSKNTIGQIDHLLAAFDKIAKSWKRSHIALLPTDEQRLLL